MHEQKSFSLPLLFSFPEFSVCLSKSYIMFFFAFTGRALRDGREADLYEAAARKPLHAGPGLFKDLFVRAVCLHCLRFWMVMTSLIRFPGWDYTVTLNFLSSVILNFFHYMFTKQPPPLLWTFNSIPHNFSCVLTFVNKNTSISLQNFICLNILVALHIYWITNTTVFMETNYTFEIVDGSWKLFLCATVICIMSSDLLEFN